MFSSIGAYDFVTEQRVIEDVAIELLPLAKDILDCHPCRHVGIHVTLILKLPGTIKCLAN